MKDDLQQTPAEIRHHRTVLAMSCAAILLAFAMEVRPHGRVALRAFPEHPFPHTCMSRSLFDTGCPGCGLTRSFIYLAEGDWTASVRAHACGWLLALTVLLQLPYRTMALLCPGRLPFGRRLPTLIGYSLICVLIGAWLVRVLADSKHG